MKIVRITMTMTVSEDMYEKELKEVKQNILSGEFQKEIKDNQKGVEKVKITFENLN